MLYENQLIGQFIYNLGVYSGKFFPELNNEIQLIQQTPYDKSLGDFLTKFNAKFLLIEFKRNHHSIKTEILKNKYKSLISGASSNDRLLKLTKSCHYLAFGDEISFLKFNFYILLGQKTFADNSISMNSFLKKINEDEHIGLSNFKDFVEYIDFLVTTEDKTDSSNCLMVAYSKSQGVIIQESNSIKDLLQSLNKNRQSIKHTPEINRSIGRSL